MSSSSRRELTGSRPADGSPKKSASGSSAGREVVLEAPKPHERELQGGRLADRRRREGRELPERKTAAPGERPGAPKHAPWTRLPNRRRIPSRSPGRAAQRDDADPD